ncbi:hypothetical protein CGC20_34890 [Leishmania donovani]|uniref:Uncharacterized protein n=1 Tax=Leishmania donovani TaxID=5661 RepID=A0A3Q8IGE9_LEIDO|nr:hypothetical protein LdCL_320037800 [Leishmania donovani]TPP43825.1 hypothetical protein CGC21_21120 [Leishmania donovani]TPP47323.1 hypothetical protein CGC20_34890 [Leishmania donovani]
MYKWHIDILLFPYVIAEVFAKGYNFIPVYENADASANVTQILMAKMVIVLIYRSESEGVCVGNMQLVLLQRFKGSTMSTKVFVHLQGIAPSGAAFTSKIGDKVGWAADVAHRQWVDSRDDVSSRDGSAQAVADVGDGALMERFWRMGQ